MDAAWYESPSISGNGGGPNVDKPVVTSLVLNRDADPMYHPQLSIVLDTKREN